ncbi:hypothetical protein BKX93_19975 [Chromobacterium vaccinii]|uniref:Uncharacterized protein n=1 Tax=Chromobacterium vaccinii TaxID=1108595 RepID=A0A1D9LLD7_9NEIS|nr:hypothetical protein BKX93_19975 [Chromobacterium vaccinii]
MDYAGHRFGHPDIASDIMFWHANESLIQLLTRTMHEYIFSESSSTIRSDIGIECNKLSHLKTTASAGKNYRPHQLMAKYGASVCRDVSRTDNLLNIRPAYPYMIRSNHNRALAK